MSNRAIDGSLLLTKLSKYWPLLIFLLIVVIAVGSLITWSRYSRSQPVEISISPGQELEGEVYIGGSVNNPGFYKLKAGDSIDDIIQAAGGTSSDADLNQLKLYVPEEGETPPQKINLNRADLWLLQALPEIGEVRAQAIIDYRQQNGHFRNINELTEVEGIGTATYEKIKHLITVAE